VTGVLADWEDAPQALLARATKVVVTRAPLIEEHPEFRSDPLAAGRLSSDCDCRHLEVDT
jgi:hypothetical protein